MREGKTPKSEGMSVDLAALSPLDCKKKDFYFSGQTQNTVIYYIIYAHQEWQRFMALVKKRSNWD